MSVIIKDMEMPEKCTACGYFYYEPLLGIQRCKLTNLFIEGYSGDFPKSCPIVGLPEHHGRLIDADRLMRVYEDRLEKVIDRYGVDSSERGILSGAMKLLMIELGIVEAE